MAHSLTRLVATVGLLLLACTGAPGTPGATGAPGTNGTNGAPGTQGSMGNTGAPGSDGTNGTNGANALVRSSPEAAGANCLHGGTKLEVGLDANGNGRLDANEINATSTTYVCDGAGKNSLVKTSLEPAGSNCAFGGTKIETGLDANDNHTLDSTEVDPLATTYACSVAPSGTISPSTGIHVAYKNVSTSTTAPITVRFTLKDDRNFPLDLQGRYSQNLPMQPRFSLGSFTVTNGKVSPMTTYTKATSSTAPSGLPTNLNPLGTAAGHGTLVENGVGAGDYTYTFPSTSTTNGPVGVNFDPTKLDETHVVWIQATRQTDEVFPTNANTFYAANESFSFVPSGVGTPAKREIVSQAGCDGCHAKFKTESTTAAAFHGGGRVAVGMCNVCHNPGRTTNPDANSSAFIHRIHNGANVATGNLFHGIAATYPRDIRDCKACHGGALQETQALNNPTALACNGCHDYVSYTNSAAATCGILGNLTRGADGKPTPCNHVAGAVADSTCASCHAESGGFATSRYHAPVASPDPTNLWLQPMTGNANTNASFVAAGGFVPNGASVITTVIKSVDVVVDGAGIKRPQITFKLQKDNADVVFQTYSPSVTELMPNFVGSPSVYFAFAVTQDNNPTPADFNASASGYLRSIWNGTATSSGAGTMSGPGAGGFYVVTLTGVQIPPDATMVTGGVGYTYSLSLAPPLVQTNVPGYPWTPNVPADGKAQGGLSVPSPNVWKVATGYTGRRAIVDTAKCNSCHGTLGVTPTFHAGQRNDGATCSFCHTPNRTSSGWSAGSKYFIHALHAGRKRVVDFTWHAQSAGPGYDGVEFPGTLNTCTTCHLPNTYDFTNPTNLAALSKMQLTTVATGRYDVNPLVNSTYYTVSPFVTADGMTDYGVGFSYTAANNSRIEAAPSTLVMSQLTGACSACHDSTIALNHMKANGGLYYSRRDLVPAGGSQEQCLICHGPGRIAAIGLVHQR